MDSKTLNDLGEAGIIQLIGKKGAQVPPPYLRKGIGDDCAVLETPHSKALLVTTDTLIEGTHFTDKTLPPEALGWKALAVNISDIVAMGGSPRTAFLSAGLQPGTSVDFLNSFMAGFNALAGKAGIVLAGGDTVESPSFMVVTITLLGDSVPEYIVYRSGAKPGDDVWVTGPLGNAAAGLFVLQNSLYSHMSEYAPLIRAHQKPVPPLESGKALAQKGLAHAMIDISDGIAKDLGHICEQSNTGAMLQADSIPMSDDLLSLAAKAGGRPLDWALHGGEDYELLFTASSSDEENVVALTTEVSGSPPTKIGTIIEEDGIWLEGDNGAKRLEPGGYVHFS